MKKKSIYLICGIVLVAAIATLLAFVFSGNNTPTNAVFDVTGTWRVVTYVTGEGATLIDKEFMVKQKPIVTAVQNLTQAAVIPWIVQ